MTAIAYYLALPLLYGIALLPWGLLYVLSDLCFVLVYGMAGYRRRVVRSNLRNSFPEKSEAERRKIERDFYRWFCDLWLETLKTLTISGQDLERRVVVKNTDVLSKYSNAGKA